MQLAGSGFPDLFHHVRQHLLSLVLVFASPRVPPAQNSLWMYRQRLPGTDSGLLFGEIADCEQVEEHESHEKTFVLETKLEREEWKRAWVWKGDFGRFVQPRNPRMHAAIFHVVLL